MRCFVRKKKVMFFFPPEKPKMFAGRRCHRHCDACRWRRIPSRPPPLDRRHCPRSRRSPPLLFRLPAAAVPHGLSPRPRRRRLRRRHRRGGEGAPLAATTTASSLRPPPCASMTRCRRPGPAPWRRRRRQRRCHHRRERQGLDDPEDHAPAVAIDFVVVVIVG